MISSMASDRDLALLAHGVRIWNEAVSRPGFGRADLSGVTLPYRRLKAIDFRGADLTGANLRHAKLTGADLTHAVLDDADLSGAILDHVVGRNASIKRAKLIGASLRETVFEQTEFTDSDLSDADFGGSILEKSIFLRTLLARTKFDNANLKSAVFYHGEMVEAILTGADFTGAYFGTMAINDVALASAIGIAATHHRAPSFVSLGTLRKPITQEVHQSLSKAGVTHVELAFGNIWSPDLQDHEIIDVAYNIARVRTISAIVLNPLFISYAHADRAFV